ncbi:ribulose-phosphate 3-epimerase [Mycoplasma sp. OR1901]|uniref:ribulose-phosphate 3-epimerase n=1 Tax=Mycoplasma sp. OR1901 TaxID=2742195 RepID=UPI0015838291|nr:ribulose-phosphate 3-epimerase [Mycoplasma sp. OR1901]QKT05588.1 ribulose-phosphate 3-epimerase [Mycoplasma sp. OR1901]
MKKYVTPSLLNVKPEERLQMANTLIDEGIKWIHYDVMDGKFVENTAITVEEIKNINKNAKHHMKDAHLMVVNPYDYVEQLKNDVDILTFHYEAIENDLDKFNDFLTKNKHELKIGLAIKPDTPIDVIEEFLDRLALVLVMSVEPGKGGQKFIDSSLVKISQLKNIRLQNFYDFLIQVDGGINDLTGPQAFKKGADACVAGTFLVKSPNQETINSILGKKYSNN